MKNKLAISFLFGLLCFIGSANAQNSFHKKFSGSINNRFAIEMTLEREGSLLAGSYSYANIGQTIKLRGSIDAGQAIELDEYDEHNLISARFTGKLAGKKFSGAWQKLKDNKPLPFSLDIIDEAVKPIALEGGVFIGSKQTLITSKADSPPAPIRRPIARGLDNGPLLKKVQALLDPQKIFRSSYEELNGWLTGIDYRVNYNAHYLLDITFTLDGVGAYPDRKTKNIVINLKTGVVVKAADAFEPAALPQLAGLINQTLQAAIKRNAREKLKEFGDTVRNDVTVSETFVVGNLDDFSVSAKGVTFFFEFGFPHVIKALEPEGQFFFPYDQLKPYIQRDGLLGVFVK